LLSNPPIADADARLRVGRISGAHGLRGALRIRPDNPDSDTLEHASRVFIEQPGGDKREYRLMHAERINRTTIRVTLEGLDDPDAAAALRGASVSVLTSELPAKAPGEFYHYEAIGCEVATTDGRRLGIIEEVLATGANDVWVVRDGATEVLVPVIDNVVKSMDFAARRIVVEAVPGLLDTI
jgi:16S rRNA processing protein RimM